MGAPPFFFLSFVILRGSKIKPFLFALSFGKCGVSGILLGVIRQWKEAVTCVSTNRPNFTAFLFFNFESEMRYATYAKWCRHFSRGRGASKKQIKGNEILELRRGISRHR